MQTAIEFARQYETTLATQQVCNYDEFGVGEDAHTRAGAVEHVTPTGVFVRAAIPYWYTTSNAEADGVSRGIYFVANGSFSRIDLAYGPDGRHLDTYAPNGTPSVDRAQSIRVLNFANESATVTVRLNYTGGNTTHAVLNQTYNITTGVELYDVAARSGAYTLTAGTNDGDTESLPFDLGDDQPHPPPIAVYVAPNGSLHVFQIEGSTAERVSRPLQNPPG